MVSLRPHIATLCWNTKGTYDSNKRFVEGTPVELMLSCRIKPSAFKIKVEDGGNKYQVNQKVYADLFSEEVPEVVRIRLYGKEYPAKVFKYQTHVEIWVLSQI